MSLSKQEKRNQAKKVQEAAKAKKKVEREAKQKATEQPTKGKPKAPVVKKKK